MPAMISHHRWMIFTVATVLLLTSAGLAQQPGYNRGNQQQPPSKWFEGELKSVNRNGFGVESDGKQAVIPVTGATKLTVTANGDPGFLKPGVTVTVQGERRTTTPAIMNATLTAHMSPRETAAPQIREIDAAGELVTFNAVIVQTEPDMIVRAIDAIQLKRKVGNNWVKAAPQRNLTMPVKLHDRMADNVAIRIGRNASMAKEGDAVRFEMVQGIPVAKEFEITLSEKLDSSKFAQPETKKKGKSRKDKKDDDAKPDDAKPEADSKPTAEGTTTPEAPATEGQPEGESAPAEGDGAKPAESATE